MYIINIEKLQVGDIILTRRDNAISAAIREQSNSEYSHAMLYVTTAGVIESGALAGMEVHSDNILRKGYQNIDDVMVLRLKSQKDKQAISSAIEFARNMIGVRYSRTEAFRAVSKNNHKAVNPDRQFCTRFVAQAYDRAGVKLVANSDYCSPQELLESTALIEVGSVLRLATKEEEEMVNSDSPVNDQANISSNLFKVIREVTPDEAKIQTFEDLCDFLLENPSFDNAVTGVLKSSGYLEMQKNLKKENPWMYSREAFDKYSIERDDRITGALTMLNSVSTVTPRLLRNFSDFSNHYASEPLDFFYLMKDLYADLIMSTKEMESVARSVLDEYR